MTKLFKIYVENFLRRIDVSDGERFFTSHPSFGMILYDSGTFYAYKKKSEDNYIFDRTLTVSEIVYILEETDIKKAKNFIEISFQEALTRMKANEKIFVEMDGDDSEVKLITVKATSGIKAQHFSVTVSNDKKIKIFYTITELMNHKFHKIR